MKKTATTLEDLFVHDLKDVYHAEKQLVRALPKMAKAATSEKLRQAIEEHLAETENQVERLEQVFQTLEVGPRGVKCAAMEGLIEEGKEVLESELDDPVKDAAIIGAANKVEHYEIASYGTLVSLARLLGHSEAEKLLQETLEEEKNADRKLTELAESEINLEAD
ncbi:MAG TPA: ferritin-like domain-containing protein [Planctomycetaceae bacterium]|nr:ferritin-like domain-containing protein [Planctomycetaceae bacterium]